MYNGYLLKVGKDIFPTKYIAEQSYTITPHQRQDEDPWRDENGVLHREVADNMPSTIDFSTIAGITDSELAKIIAILKANYTNETERKLLVTYFDPETGENHGPEEMYLANMSYKIDCIENGVVRYDSVSFSLVGY